MNTKKVKSNYLKVNNLFKTNITNSINKIITIQSQYDLDQIETNDLVFIIDNPIILSNPRGLSYNYQQLLDDILGKDPSAIVCSSRIIIDHPLVIKVDDIYITLNQTLNQFYNYPFKRHQLIGITGTDGKTSTGCYLEFLLDDYKVAFIPNDPDLDIPNKLVNLYLQAHEYFNNKYHGQAIELDAISIKNHLIDYLKFDIAVFTNFSEDFFDVFETKADYFDTKYQLFKSLKPDGIAIVNGDDNYYSHFLELPNLISFGLKEHNDYKIQNVVTHQGITTFDLITPNMAYYDLYINRSELYHLYNVMPSIIIAQTLGLDLDHIFKKLSKLPKLDYQMQKLNYSTINNNQIYFDSAKTINSLNCVLNEVKKNTSNNLYVVLPTTKDLAKGFKMGQMVSNLADYVVFTSSDDGFNLDLLSDMSKLVEKNNYAKIPSRKEALIHAIKKLETGDTLLITGKPIGSDLIIEEYLRLNTAVVVSN